MKKILTIFVLLISIQSFAQSRCSCSGMFGECKIECKNGDIANCEEKWWGGCSCKCNERTFTNPGLEMSPIGIYRINAITTLRNIIAEVDTNYPNLAGFDSFIQEISLLPNGEIYEVDQYYRLMDWFEALMTQVTIDKRTEIKRRIDNI